jgi:hypothetical protein
MLEADFTVSCSQCGGQDFQEVFPVPAETYHLYGPQQARQRPQVLTALVYACRQCGHLEKFLDLHAPPEKRSDADSQAPRHHLDARR